MGLGGTKRQETTSLRSSSSRRDSTSPVPGGHQSRRHVETANVGCMSGIFHLVSKYHTRRKFLTFGKRQERQTKAQVQAQAQATAPPKPESVMCPSRDQTSCARISLEVPRSPAIPADIRSSGPAANSPRVVARLMGLDHAPPQSPSSSTVAPPSPVVEPSSLVVVPPSPVVAPLCKEVAPPSSVVDPPSPVMAAEKRRKLMGALERCDEDLKALKKIIEAVRVAQMPSTPKRLKKNVEEVEEAGSEGPSPVSVLDYHYQRSPALTSYSERIPNGQVLQQEQKHVNQQRQQVTKKKPGEEDNNATFYFQSKTTSSVMATVHESPYLFSKSRELLNNATTRRPTQWSREMRESVAEVCRDVAWGQRREVARTGLLIQEFIYKDLVEEIIKEMGCCHVYGDKRSLPFEACKRKLCF